MREQVIPQKVGNRSGIAAKRRPGGSAQRPARRDEGFVETLGARLRAALSYLPVLLKVTIAITVGALIFVGYRAAAAASFFQIRNVEVQGESRASRSDVQALVRREVGKTGVWQADLKEISVRLERLPWIRTAIVSRVLPDGIRVRLAEREPRAVVRTGAGRFFWVDEDAVMLGEMLPTDQLPAFFLRGWNEEDGETVRLENSERVRKFLDLRHDWDNAGLSDRVSEVNLLDLRDVRAQLAGDDSQIEVRLGSKDLGKRLKQALEVLDGQRNTPRGALISYVDLNQGKGAIVGFISGTHSNTDAANNFPDVERKKTSRADDEVQKRAKRTAVKEKARNDSEAKATRNDKSIEARPRRVKPTP
ncbi:MAG: FtsQ-type POTRA domain-containing protein [Acidobacteriota bacterium]